MTVSGSTSSDTAGSISASATVDSESVSLTGSTSSDGGTFSSSITVDQEGSSGTNKNLPPYYALCFIMKS